MKVLKECLCGCGKTFISPDDHGRERNWISGHNSYLSNLGKKLSQEHKDKISKAHSGKKLTDKHKLKIGLSGKGVSGRKKSLNAVFSLVQEIRQSTRYRDWRKSILELDNNQCHWCGSIENVEVDHIDSIADLIHRNNIKTLDDAYKCINLWSQDNGRVLCKTCHKKTINYGNKKDRTPFLSMVIPTYTKSKHLEELAYIAACSYRKFVDELIIIEDGQMYSPKLQKIANTYIYVKKNQGFTKTVNSGWKLANGKYVAIVNSDTCLLSGNLRDICVEGKVTSPIIANQYIDRLAGPFWCTPREVTEKYGYLMEEMKTYSSDSEYDERIKDIFQKIDSVRIYHEQAQSVSEAGIEGGAEQDRDRQIYQKLKEEGKAK
jgi:hypothetical protein